MEIQTPSPANSLSCDPETRAWLSPRDLFTSGLTLAFGSLYSFTNLGLKCLKMRTHVGKIIISGVQAMVTTN